MEIATKALLIAAAVLIVILLIAFGMSIFNSTGDVADQATGTGNLLTQQTNAAGTAANNALQGLNKWTN